MHEWAVAGVVVGLSSTEGISQAGMVRERNGEVGGKGKNASKLFKTRNGAKSARGVPAGC